MKRAPKRGCVAEQGSSWQPLAEGHEVFDRVLWAGLLQNDSQIIAGNVSPCCLSAPGAIPCSNQELYCTAAALPSVPVSFPALSCQFSTQGRREIPIFPVELGLAPSLPGRAVAIDAAETWFPVPLFLASEVRDLNVETSQKISN